MANGTTKDLRKVLIVIDDVVINNKDLVEAPEIQLPQNMVEVVGGTNAGGFEFVINNNVDGQITINFYKRDYPLATLQKKYLNAETITLYVKDENTQMVYANGTPTYIGNVGSYTLGASEAVEITILMPDFVSNKA